MHQTQQTSQATCRTCDDPPTVSIDGYLYCPLHGSQQVAAMIEYGTKGETRQLEIIADGPGIVRIRERQTREREQREAVAS